MKIGNYKYKIALSAVDSKNMSWTIEWVSLFNFWHLFLYNYSYCEYTTWKIYKFSKDVEI